MLWQWQRHRKKMEVTTALVLLLIASVADGGALNGRRRDLEFEEHSRIVDGEDAKEGQATLITTFSNQYGSKA